MDDGFYFFDFKSGKYRVAVRKMVAAFAVMATPGRQQNVLDHLAGFRLSVDGLFCSAWIGLSRSGRIRCIRVLLGVSLWIVHGQRHDCERAGGDLPGGGC